MPPLDGCDDMELFLNLLWLAIGVAALLTAPRRSMHVSMAIACALTLLFPIVSVSDDLADHDSFEEALAIVVKAVILAVMFVTIARVETTSRRRAALLLVPTTDPRSPPLG